MNKATPVLLLLVFVNAVLFAGTCFGQSAAAAKSKTVFDGAQPADQALADIIWACSCFPDRPSSEIIENEKRHSAVRRLVDYLKHKDTRVRSSAQYVLTQLQHECKFGPDEYERWNAWFNMLERRVKVSSKEKRPVVSGNTPSQDDKAEVPGVADALFETIEILRKFPTESKRMILTDESRHKAVIRLIELHKHSDKRVRSSSNFVLISIQPDCPYGPDDYEKWAAWLKRLEQGGSSKSL